jgi:hypothetical protein
MKTDLCQLTPKAKRIGANKLSDESKCERKIARGWQEKNSESAKRKMEKEVRS